MWYLGGNTKESNGVCLYDSSDEWIPKEGEVIPDTENTGLGSCDPKESVLHVFSPNRQSLDFINQIYALAELVGAGDDFQGGMKALISECFAAGRRSVKAK